MSLTAAASATTSSAALRALAERIQSLGLLRNERLRLVTGVGLALFGISALRRASDRRSQAKLNNCTKDTYDWPHEIVVVTGGSGGLGAPLVEKFAALGATVISLDITPPKAPLPANAHFYKVDLTSRANIKEVAAQIRRDHGDPTVLVNNAGISRMLCLFEESDDEIESTFQVNIISHFTLVKEFLPAMVARNHGHIVTVASMRSFVAGCRGVDYACTKAGALALNEGIAQEVRHQYNAPKIRTSVAHPAFVRTPIIDKCLEYAEANYNIMDAETVADGIFKHILSGNSGQLFFPKHMWAVAGIRGWPAWLQERIRDSQIKGIVPYYLRNSN